MDIESTIPKSDMKPEQEKLCLEASSFCFYCMILHRVSMRGIFGVTQFNFLFGFVVDSLWHYITFN